MRQVWSYSSYSNPRNIDPAHDVILLNFLSCNTIKYANANICELEKAEQRYEFIYVRPGATLIPFTHLFATYIGFPSIARNYHFIK